MKVCVIGAGVAGIATAYFLAERGHQVTVLERRSAAAQETSFANACLLTPSQSLPWNEPGIVRQAMRWLLEEDGALVIRPRLDPAMWEWLVRFAVYSRRHLHERHAAATLRLARLSIAELDRIAERHAIAFDRTRTGIVTLVRPPDQPAAARASAAKLNDMGIAARILGPEETVALEPALEPIAADIACAIHTADDGSGDIYKFCTAMADIVARMGVHLRFGTEMKRFTTVGRRILSVEFGDGTGGGAIEADAVVLATGIASRAFARELGIKLPIYPVQGCSLTVSTAGWPLSPVMPVRDRVLKIAAAPLTGALRIAGMAILNGGSLAIAERHYETLRRALASIFPTLPVTAAATRWTGLRPMTPDGPPLIGPTTIENLFLNTGQGPLGWTLGCGSARIVAELVGGRPAPIPLDGLTVDRYRL